MSEEDQIEVLDIDNTAVRKSQIARLEKMRAEWELITLVTAVWRDGRVRGKRVPNVGYDLKVSLWVFHFGKSFSF